MENSGKPSFRLRRVPLALSRSDESRLMGRIDEARKEIDREIFGEEDFSKAYHRPPGRPDLSYGDANQIVENRLSPLSALLKSARKPPRSQVKIPQNAWAWNLRKFRPKLDDLSRGLLQDFELFLCRHVIRLVEDKGEKIRSATLTLSNESAVVYRMWPTEGYRTKSTVNARAELRAKIGLTEGLEVIELPVSGGASVVWQGNWKWVSAIIKAWGVGDSASGWMLERDPRVPFSGDREMYLMLQLPRRAKPIYAMASLEAEIKPNGVKGFFRYDTKSIAPLKVAYSIA